MKLSLSFLFIYISLFSFCQTELVFVYFKDKPNASIFLSNPLSELTQKSINRRANLNIPITEQDAPIETSYIQNIQNLGFTVTDQSKWLNGVAVNATSAQITQLQSEPYVLKVESFVKNSTVAKQAKISRIEKSIVRESKKISGYQGLGRGGMKSSCLRGMGPPFRVTEMFYN